MAKPKLQTLVGRIVRRHVGGKSKYAHPGVVLETDAGTFVLRREGATSFVDPELVALDGKSVRVRGETDGHVLFVTSWEEI